MDTNLEDLRKAAIDKFDGYLIEREKTRTKCKDFESWHPNNTLKCRRSTLG